MHGLLLLYFQTRSLYSMSVICLEGSTIANKYTLLFFRIRGLLNLIFFTEIIISFAQNSLQNKSKLKAYPIFTISKATVYVRLLLQLT